MEPRIILNWLQKTAGIRKEQRSGHQGQRTVGQRWLGMGTAVQVGLAYMSEPQMLVQGSICL